jgi:hypothetical protein
VPEPDEQQSGQGNGEQVSTGDGAKATDAPKTAAAKQKATPADAPTDDVFPRERLLGRDGPGIVGQPAPVIAGALAAVQRDELTREEIDQAVEDFLGHEDTTKPAEA